MALPPPSYQAAKLSLKVSSFCRQFPRPVHEAQRRSGGLRSFAFRRDGKNESGSHRASTGTNLSVPEELRPDILAGADRPGWRSDEPPGRIDWSWPGEKESLGSM